MTDKTISRINYLDGKNCFRLIFSRKRGPLNTLQFYLDQFDINDYYIYKSTFKQREVSIEELYNFKYSGYVFYRKEIYNKNDINEWIKWIDNISMIQYFNKPLPPISLMKKIRIIK